MPAVAGLFYFIGFKRFCQLLLGVCWFSLGFNRFCTCLLGFCWFSFGFNRFSKFSLGVLVISFRFLSVLPVVARFLLVFLLILTGFVSCVLFFLKFCSVHHQGSFFVVLFCSCL